MGHQKNAKKLIRDVFRQYGAHIQGREKESTRWIFPDGAVIIVHPTATYSWAAAQCRNLEARYGRRSGEGLAGAKTRPGKPSIDFERLDASAHAKERLKLMRQQDGIDLTDVFQALKLPEKVLWSESNGSWLWVRDRIAVAVAVVGDRFVVTTVLWSSDELFVQFPRPLEAK